MASSISGISIQSILGSSGSNSAGTGRAGSGASNSSLKINGEDAAKISLSQSGSPSRPPSGPRNATAISFRESADTAQNAISQISSLRDRQIELAENASSRAIGDPALDDLNTELNNIQTEIERIQSSATVNGRNVLSGIGLGGADSSGTSSSSSQASQVNLVDATTLSRNPGKISDPGSALTTLENLQELKVSSSQLLGSSQSAANSIEKATQPEPAQVANRKADDGRSAEKAEQAVKTVTTQIVTELGAESGNQEQFLLEILSSTESRT